MHDYFAQRSIQIKTRKWRKRRGNFLLDDAHTHRKSPLKSVQIAGGETFIHHPRGGDLATDLKAERPWGWSDGVTERV